ncbi:MAG: hypothetical protein IPO63_17395 [Bacteroidetes bacterium]|nr:hypothetical protein [Bacteroidota bacterium]
MKKLGWCYLLFCFILNTNANAQKGLEKIIVEKYYISTAKDTVGADSMGYLPIGSVTYRIFADLQPVYRLQAVYGVPEHELRIETTTRFFNAAIGDGRSANDVQPLQLVKGALLLDSWVTVGAAAVDYLGVLKADDDSVKSYGANNIQGILKNNDPQIGIPLTEKDGMKYLRYQPATQYYNLENDLKIFEYQHKDSVKGLFSTRDGAWASYGGSVGPQPENRILIAQLTTDGVLNFELNMQLAVPNGGVEKFVAKNPREGEVEFSELRYSSSPNNKAPIVSLIGPELKKLTSPQILEFSAMASDSDNGIITVDFYINDKLVATDTDAPYIFKYNYVGQSVKVSATAVDAGGARARSEDFIIPAMKKQGD